MQSIGCLSRHMLGSHQHSTFIGSTVPDPAKFFSSYSYVWLMRSAFKTCILVVVTAVVTPTFSFGQKTQFDLDYGRAFFYYKVKDNGNGFKNEPASHYNFIAGLGLRVNYPGNRFIQTGIRFTMYQQYFSTSKSWGVYHDAYPIIHFPLLIGLRKPFNKVAGEISAGPVIGVMPDQYYGEFITSRYVNPTTVDSLARGSVLREYGPVFPLLSITGGVDYRLSAKFTLYIKGAAGWGFRTISRFNVHYNDGSGFNDQTATQWGRGNFSSVSIGVRSNFRLVTIPHSRE